MALVQTLIALTHTLIALAHLNSTQKMHRLQGQSVYKTDTYEHCLHLKIGSDESELKLATKLALEFVLIISYLSTFSIDLNFPGKITVMQSMKL